MLMRVGKAKNKSNALLVLPLLAGRGRNGEVVKIRGEETGEEVERVGASRSSISYHRAQGSTASFNNLVQ